MISTLLSITLLPGPKSPPRHATYRAPSKVQIVEFKPGKFRLLVDGKTFFVKGAGAPPEEFPNLQRFGCNAVRTWGVDEKTGAYLDQAQKHGIKVMVGFWMRKADGFSYRNAEMLKQQQDEFRKYVRMYRNHPNLLMWAVGNEVEIGGESPEIYIQTEKLAQIAKEEDPNHPVIGVYADMWQEKMDSLLKYCKSLDALGINTYEGFPSIHERLKPWNKPIFITEYQYSLPSKSEKEPWAGFIEPSSEAKAASTLKNYHEGILSQPDRVLGGYFFYWNRSKIGTASVHSSWTSTGEWLPVVRVMAQVWGGKVPKNRAPVVRIEKPNNPTRIKRGETLVLTAVATDADKDKLTLNYELLPNDPSKRFVGDHEQNLGVLSKGGYAKPTKLKMPKDPGLYRILVIARDGQGAAGTAYVSLLVE